IVADKNLQLDFRGKTIDTVSRAQLQIEEITKRNQSKLAGGTLLINKSTATEGELLMVDSPRLGKLEPEDMLEEASIIDVYDLTDESYAFSFYSYEHEKSKVREFILTRGTLYALQGNHLVAYKLHKKVYA